MLKELECYLDYCVGKRTEEIAQVILLKNSYYRNLMKGKRYAFDELLKNIPKSCKDLLFDLEEKEKNQAAFAYEIMYRQGLLDGLNFRNTALNNHIHEQYVGNYKEGTGIN